MGPRAYHAAENSDLQPRLLDEEHGCRASGLRSGHNRLVALADHSRGRPGWPSEYFHLLVNGATLLSDTRLTAELRWLVSSPIISLPTKACSLASLCRPRRVGQERECAMMRPIRRSPNQRRAT